MAKGTKSGRTAAKTTRGKTTRGKTTRAGKALRKSQPALKPKARKAAGKPKAAKTKAKPSVAAVKAKAAKAKAKTKATPKVAKARTTSAPKAQRALESVPKPRTAAKVRSPTVAKGKSKASRARARKPQPPKLQSLVARIEAQNLKVRTGRDWSETLFLPKTDFPMKAGLPEREPELLKRWRRSASTSGLREDAKGRAKFVLHDGPPYANGNIHIGTGLNKILKDVVVRSQTMMGKDANYVPGWDCHGLPIEWKVEEENYRAKGKIEARPRRLRSDDCLSCRVPRLCRALAERAARGIQAARRRGRLGPSLHHHELRRRGDYRRRADEVRHERAALSRV